MRRLKTCWAVAVAMGALLVAQEPAFAQEFNFGKVGDPIQLSVAHPCCYTEVWSVFALNGNDLWKKHLPAGSTVDYQIGLQGTVVVNQMLAALARA
jgi:NitT/TauT family transport system substrate-binding protein